MYARAYEKRVIQTLNKNCLEILKDVIQHLSRDYTQSNKNQLSLLYEAWNSLNILARSHEKKTWQLL